MEILHFVNDIPTITGNMEKYRTFQIPSSTKQKGLKGDYSNMTPRDVIRQVAKELRDSENSTEETIIITFEDDRFPWKVSVTADAWL